MSSKGKFARDNGSLAVDLGAECMGHAANHGFRVMGNHGVGMPDSLSDTLDE